MVFDICMISPLTKHSFLLSSRTVFYIDHKIRKWSILTNFLKTAFFTEQQHHTHFLFAISTQKNLLTIVQATRKCVEIFFGNCSINNKLHRKKKWQFFKPPKKGVKLNAQQSTTRLPTPKWQKRSVPCFLSKWHLQVHQTWAISCQCQDPRPALSCSKPRPHQSTHVCSHQSLHIIVPLRLTLDSSMLSAPEKVFQARKASTHHPDQSSIVEIQLQQKSCLVAHKLPDAILHQSSQVLSHRITSSACNIFRTDPCTE